MQSCGHSITKNAKPEVEICKTLLTILLLPLLCFWYAIIFGICSRWLRARKLNRPSRQPVLFVSNCCSQPLFQQTYHQCRKGKIQNTLKVNLDIFGYPDPFAICINKRRSTVEAPDIHFLKNIGASIK